MVLAQADVDKTTEVVAPVSTGKRRRVVLSNVIERTHRVHVEERRLALSYQSQESQDKQRLLQKSSQQFELKTSGLTEFNAGDSKGPDIDLAIVLSLIHGQDDFRCHPVWRADERVGRTHE